VYAQRLDAKDAHSKNSVDRTEAEGVRVLHNLNQVCVYVYVCMLVCMYVCMYICICICMYVCVCMCVCVYIVYSDRDSDGNSINHSYT
jgi:hypothetical protein